VVDRRVIFCLDAGICYLCDLPIETEAFHLDHIIPLAADPIEAAFNYAVTHPMCNFRKNDRFEAHPLSSTVRARWQQQRPEHLVQLEAHIARIVAARSAEQAAA